MTLGREAKPDLEGPYVMLSLCPESAGNSLGDLKQENDMVAFAF